MSFSGQVKEELSNHTSKARHCEIAELAALIEFCGTFNVSDNGEYVLRIHTENQAVARKVFTLIEKPFNIKADILVRRNRKRQSVSYLITVADPAGAYRVLKAVRPVSEQIPEEGQGADPSLLQRTCCKRAFIRGAFLAAGSMSDPVKAYHFEIVCPTKEIAEQIRELILDFSVDAKVVLRKKSYVVYLKEGAQIVDMLNIMEAHLALMDLENVRILKDVRNTVNRKVNCETANINKTVSAAVRQMEDIQYLQETIGLDRLSEGLKETALVRLDNPDASLKELGEFLSPPVGKSGVNHRLRKLSEIADKVREEQGGLI